MAKIKEKEGILKEVWEKQHTRKLIYKRTPIRLWADILAETLQARREWHHVFKVIKGKNL